MIVSYLRMIKGDDWYKDLKTKINDFRVKCRKLKVTLPAYACTVKIPELKITDAIKLDYSFIDEDGEGLSSSFLTADYNVKMRFDKSDASLFLATEKDPSHFCELIQGRDLRGLIVKAFVDVEGFFLETKKVNIKKALK